MARYLPVIRHPAFGRVLPVLLFSALGDGMSAVAIGWLALQLAPPHDRGLWVGLAVAAYTLPGAVGAVLFAPLLRGRGGAHLTACDGALRAVFLGAVPLLSLTGELTIGRYTVLLALSALLSAWGTAGRYTLIAQMLPRELHLPANALLTVIAETSTVIGPAVAGLLIAGFGAPVVLGVDAVTFAVLAVTFLRLPEEPQVDAERSRTAGFSLIRQDRHLLGLTVLTFWFFLLFGPIPVAVPLSVTAPGQVGLLYTAFGVGAVVGAVATGRLPQVKLWPTTIGVVIGFGLLLIPLGLRLPLAANLVTLALAGLVWAPYPATSMSLFQRTVPAARLSQVLAARGAVVVVSTPLGTLLGAPLVQAVGPSTTFVTCGAATAVVGLVALAVHLRARPVAQATSSSTLR